VIGFTAFIGIFLQYLAMIAGLLVAKYENTEFA